VDFAAACGFDGISINKSYAFDEFADKCQQYGLTLDLWTFRDTVKDNDLMYKDMKKKGWDPTRITVDFKPYN